MEKKSFSLDGIFGDKRRYIVDFDLNMNATSLTQRRMKCFIVTGALLYSFIQLSGNTQG
jgi:hypothetical protein